jgi:two-component system, cell cycle sensor histidine kinase and response regulator CckA
VPATSTTPRLFDRISDACFALDGHRCITEVNAAAERLIAECLGAPEFPLGARLPEDFPALRQAPLRAAIEHAFATQTPATLEISAGARRFETSLYPAADGTMLLLRDVSGRSQAVTELRRNEQRLRVLIDSVDDLVFELDTDERCVSAHGRWLEREGVTPESIVGKTVREILGDEGAPLHEAANRQALNGDPIVYDWTLPGRSGLRHMQTALAPMRDADGQIIGLVGVGRETTRQVRAEERQRLLSEASRVLAASLDYEATLAAVARLALPALADCCIVDIVEHDGRIHRVEFAHTDARKEAELRAAAMRDSPDPAWPTHPISVAIRTGTAVLRSDLIVYDASDLSADSGQDGLLSALAPVSLIAAAMTSPSGTLGALTFCFADSHRRHSLEDLAVAEELASRAALAVEHARLYWAAQTEIAQRAQAEDELRRWAHIFEHAGWGIVMASPDGSRILSMNTAFAEMHGYRVDELLGRPLEMIKAPAVSGDLQSHIRHASEQGRFVYETSHLHRDGRVFPVLTDIVAVRDEHGEMLYYAANVQDLTERNRVEEQIRQAQKMDAVGRLAGGVSHDFNNMLMIIIGFTDFLLASLEPTDRRYADAIEIRKAAERASALTRQLLAFGRHQLRPPQVVDVNGVVSDLERMLRPLLGEEIVLETRLSDTLSGVEADRGQLEQVVMNLALNARDAMLGGGRLTLETMNMVLPEGYAYRHVGIDIPAGEYVMLVVSDTGHGMDAETRGRIFEPFFSTKGGTQNSGLGLATVYGIVKQSSGYIWVDSEPGQGTTFKLCFPAAGFAQEPERAGRGPAARGGFETVLVVEDEEAVRGLTSRILREQGYKVLEAADGRVALQLLERGGVELLVTDVVMPEMGGQELIRRALALQPTLRILLMSGYTDNDMIRRGLQSVESPFLQKPFEPKSLAHAVRAVLDAPPTVTAQS